MPRIKDIYLDCAIYLYPNKQCALNGERAGGSGFLVSIPSKIYTDISHRYAVTNSHVIREGQSPVIRMNTEHGAMDVLEYEIDDWTHHPDGDDIAVCPLQIDRKHFIYRTVDEEIFLSEEDIKEEDLGIGDEVFMIGRFVDHEGKQNNTPSIRFGNISMMPIANYPNGTFVSARVFQPDLQS